MNMSRKAEFKQLMINRRNLYHLLSRFFQKEVDEEFFEIIQKIKFPVDREENALTEFRDALLRLNEYFEYDAGETLDDLAADYAKTFLGAGSAQGAAAFPYESVYTSPKHVMMHPKALKEMKNPKICWKTTSRWNWIIWPTCVMRRASIQRHWQGWRNRGSF